MRRKRIIIFLNCQGAFLHGMLKNHSKTRNHVHFIYQQHFTNYEKIECNAPLTEEDKKKLEECDVFIYTPFVREWLEWNPEYVLKLLRNDCLRIPIPYYRFYGYWRDENLWTNAHIGIPDYSFINSRNYGIPKELLNKKIHIGIPKELTPKIYDAKTPDDLHHVIENIKPIKLGYFHKCFEDFKSREIGSPVQTSDFFLQNHQNHRLFHDPAHPTNFFMYEVFRQLVSVIWKNEIEIDFNDSEMHTLISNCENTTWALPILPSTCKLLKLNFNNDTFVVFSNGIRMTTEEYYFMRLSPQNQEEILKKYNRI